MPTEDEEEDSRLKQAELEAELASQLDEGYMRDGVMRRE